MRSDSDKLHILYLPRWYPNRYDPMPGLFIERHARSVADRCRISVLYVHADVNPIPEKFETEIIRDGELFQVKVYYRLKNSRIPGIRQLSNISRFLSAHLKGFRIIINELGKPSVIHVNVLTRLGVLAMFYKLFAGTPYVITEHWTRYLPSMDNFRGFWRIWFTRMAVRHAAAVLPVTANLKRAMESHGLKNRNYLVIPNVVDTGMFMPAPDRATDTMKRFVHVSCFEDRQKNISGLLRVLRRLSEYRQDWVCQMIGEGIHFDRLVHFATELGIRDRFVIFHGLKENQELAHLMSDANFQVLFSRFENLPVVILESYACGVPVLSTNVGGISEHLNPSLGILIDSEDEEALFQKLNEMLDNPDKYSRDEIRKYALDHFSKEVIGKQLFDVYTKVIR